MKNKTQIDYSALDYQQFKKAARRKLFELESAAGAVDNTKAAQLREQIAKLDSQIAKLELQKANLQKQIDAIEKK